MDSTNDHSITACYRLLALCARAIPHPFMDEGLKDCIKGFTAWNDLPAQAELHGMGPLLWHHLHRLDIKLPQDIQRLITGLYLRHRVLNLEHLRILLEVTALFEQMGIQAVVLKGLALAYEYYPDPTLRPASDIDLLLKANDLLPAIKLLADAGYTAYPPHADLKQLPKELTVSSPLKDGLSIQVELHHYDPQSPPDDEFIGFDSSPHELQINGQKIYAPHFMDHLDYLIRHLSRHLFVATTTKPLPLKWIADIVSMVERHALEIDWEKQAPLLNRLEVIYSLTPFPERLSNVIPIKRIPIPHGVNQYPLGWPQHKLAEWRQVGFLNYFKKTFSSPTVWWLRLQYGIDKESVFWHGRVIYQLQILKMAFVKMGRG
jgi:hypothetical protein